MAAASNIVINDGATTPVAHTFNPQKVGLDSAEYHDRSVDVLVGRPKIMLSLVQPGRTGTVIRANARVIVPILEVTSPSTGSGIQPAPTEAYRVECDVSFRIPMRSTLQDRKHIVAYVKNLAAHSVIASLVQDLESPW